MRWHSVARRDRSSIVPASLFALALLPYALVLVAGPAGFPPTGGREVLPIWLVQAWLAMLQSVFVLPGVLAGKLRDTSKGRASS